MKDKIIKILLSFDNLTKDEIEKELKAIVKENQQDEALEIERILSATSKSKLCCMPSICFKNCNDCEIEINTAVEAHL